MVKTVGHVPGNNIEAERQRRTKARNWAIFLALAAFVAIVYVVTIVKMKGG